jgi:uncharacterized membrane protein required for colicin V production
MLVQEKQFLNKQLYDLHLENGKKIEKYMGHNTSTKEIEKVIKSLKSKNSNGYDEIFGQNSKNQRAFH